MVAALFGSNTTYLLAFVVAVAVTDMRTHRIPNLLTLPAAGLGFFLNFWSGGTHGALLSIAGLLAGGACFLPFYFLKGMGAGDVKAMGAVGAIVGPHGAVLAAAWTLIVGAICALILLIVRREQSALASLFRRWVWQFMSVYATGRPGSPVPGSADAMRRRFPYGVAIAGGSALSLLWS